MSANLDLVRSIYANWERGDFTSVEWAHPQIEFVIVGGPDPGEWRGIAGMAQGWRQWLAAWEGYRADVTEYRELGSGRVLTLGRIRGRGRTSGVTVANDFANVLDVRDGRVTRLCLYYGRERAFADLGLAPEGRAAAAPD
jgi:ketosteroid isomerase-like protein